MSTKITPDDIHAALDEMDYDPDECSETIELDFDIFQELAVIAHELDITVNALVSALIHTKCKEMSALDHPSIPGVGSAPYMEEDWKS